MRPTRRPYSLTRFAVSFTLTAVLAMPTVAVASTNHITQLETSSAAKPERWQRDAVRSKVAHNPTSEWAAPAVSGQVIVVTNSTAAAGVAALSAEVLGGDARQGRGHQVLVRVPKGRARSSFARGLERLPGVEDVQPNYIYMAEWVPNDPSLNQQWGLADIGVRTAWDVSRGSGVTVAVVDTGVDLTHADLAARMDTVNDYDFVNADSTAQDDDGHGTHVAGIIAATADNGTDGAGVAPEVKILPVKVLDRNGSGTSWMVSNGIRYAQQKGADVINLSLGGRTNDTAIASAVADVKDDCVVVAAAGNDGLAGADYPARLPGVLGVGAVDSQNQLASFSEYGDGVDVAAPGVDILSSALGGGMVRMSGTSMAAPFVSGTAALVIAANRAAGQTWTAADTSARLIATARDMSGAGLSIPLLRADSAVAGGESSLDDEIPGAAIGSSPVTGSVDAASDVHDVRYVYLGAGQTFSASLSAVAGTDFHLNLFGSGVTSVRGGQPIASGGTTLYPKSITYAAQTTGWYYVDVSAISGSGAYSLTWSVSGASDDTLPGIALPPSPVSGSLSKDDDPDDVYRVHMDAGQQLVAEITSAETGTDYDLWLYGNGATNFATDKPLTGSSSSSSSERFRYTALASGDFSIDVNAFSGEGDYQLTWYVGPFRADDDIPGVAAAGTHVEDSLDYIADSDDVHKVWLSAGQQITASIHYLYPNDFDLYLFDPSQTTVDSSYYVASANTPPTEGTDPSVDTFTYTATSTGYHFLDVFAYQGSGPYQLDWSVSAAPDDDIPGVSIKGSPFSETLGDTTDTNDVYRVHLDAGQGFSASLSAGTGTYFDLSLFGASATSVHKDASVTHSTRGRYPQKLQYIAPKAGYYYLQAHTYSGSGAYKLTWSRKTTPKVTKTPSAGTKDLTRKSGLVKWTTSATVIAVNGKPVSGKKVLLQRRSKTTGSWGTYWYGTTNTQGKLAKTITFRTRQTYYWRWYSTSTTKFNGAGSASTLVRVH